jgi:hypothetical protein
VALPLRLACQPESRCDRRASDRALPAFVRFLCRLVPEQLSQLCRRTVDIRVLHATHRDTCRLRPAGPQAWPASRPSRRAEPNPERGWVPVGRSLHIKIQSRDDDNKDFRENPPWGSLLFRAPPWGSQFQVRAFFSLTMWKSDESIALSAPLLS